MAEITIVPIAAFTDNYIWCISDGTQAIVVDPGQAQPVRQYLESNQMQLTHILVTHHHPDHVGGIADLKADNPTIEIIGYEHARYRNLTRELSANEEFQLIGHTFKMTTVPGHTLDHIAYYCASLNALFPGDTLFSAGCGRLFEGTPEQMHESLKSFLALPAKTKFYCAHEYTLANLDFAKTLMPSNQDLATYARQCEARRSQALPTLPGTIEVELKINPFLRQEDEELVESLKRLNYTNLNDSTAIFAATRDAKDKF